MASSQLNLSGSLASTKATRKSYTREFKLAVVKEYRQSGKLCQTCKKYGLNTKTLQRWISTYDTIYKSSKGRKRMEHQRSGIEDLCTKRDELQKQILVEEEEKQKVQNDLRILTERLAQVNESLAQKIAMRNDYDRTISETENAYKKILESSQSLLHVLKRESSQMKDRSTTEASASRTKQSQN